MIAISKEDFKNKSDVQPSEEHVKLDGWTCEECTFRNTKLDFLQCEICGTTRNPLVSLQMLPKQDDSITETPPKSLPSKKRKRSPAPEDNPSPPKRAKPNNNSELPPNLDSDEDIIYIPDKSIIKTPEELIHMFDGTWKNKQLRDIVVKGESVNGHRIFEVKDSKSVFMIMNGVKFVGVVTENGKVISWNDGDQWTYDKPTADPPQPPTLSAKESTSEVLEDLDDFDNEKIIPVAQPRIEDSSPRSIVKKFVPSRARKESPEKSYPKPRKPVKNLRAMNPKKIDKNPKEFISQRRWRCYDCKEIFDDKHSLERHCDEQGHMSFWGKQCANHDFVMWSDPNFEVEKPKVICRTCGNKYQHLAQVMPHVKSMKHMGLDKNNYGRIWKLNAIPQMFLFEEDRSKYIESRREMKKAREASMAKKQKKNLQEKVLKKAKRKQKKKTIKEKAKKKEKSKSRKQAEPASILSFACVECNSSYDKFIDLQRHMMNRKHMFGQFRFKKYKGSIQDHPDWGGHDTNTIRQICIDHSKTIKAIHQLQSKESETKSPNPKLTINKKKNLKASETKRPPKPTLPETKRPPKPSPPKKKKSKPILDPVSVQTNLLVEEDPKPPKTPTKKQHTLNVRAKSPSSNPRKRIERNAESCEDKANRKNQSEKLNNPLQADKEIIDLSGELDDIQSNVNKDVIDLTENQQALEDQPQNNKQQSPDIERFPLYNWDTLQDPKPRQDSSPKKKPALNSQEFMRRSLSEEEACIPANIVNLHSERNDLEKKKKKKKRPKRKRVQDKGGKRNVKRAKAAENRALFSNAASKRPKIIYSFPKQDKPMHGVLVLDHIEMLAAHGDLKHVVLVDLDNWPNFFKFLPKDLPGGTFVMGFHNGHFVRPKAGEPGAIIFNKLLSTSFLFVKTCYQRKDAADFHICVQVGQLDLLLGVHIPISVLSGDGGFKQLMDCEMRHDIFLVNPKNTKDHEIIFAQIKSIGDQKIVFSPNRLKTNVRED